MILTHYNTSSDHLIINIRSKSSIFVIGMSIVFGLFSFVVADGISSSEMLKWLCLGFVIIPIISLIFMFNDNSLGYWIISIGIWLLCISLTFYFRKFSIASSLVAPVCIISVILGIRYGVLSAIISSVLIVLLGTWIPDFVFFDSVFPHMLIWASSTLLWIVQLEAIESSASAMAAYEHARDLLEVARDQRVDLKQVQADMLLANQELERVSQRLSVMRQAAEEARRTEAEFVANVSHELRTPLNMIIGFSEMIIGAPQTYGQIAPALLADLNVILRNSQHLSSLIDDILDLSQIEAGRWALTKEYVVPAELVQEALTSVRPLFGSKGLYLEAAVAPDMPALFCDRTRIREVILNLLSNAGRYTEEGGVHLRAYIDGHDAVFEVADTGLGIEPDKMGKIFMPFGRLHDTIRRKHGGSGLGLSISKAFVELHQGQMWLESEPGHGTTFYVRLPLKPSSGTDSNPMRWFSSYAEYVPRDFHHQIASVPSTRYVVLEDDDIFGRLLRRYLGDAELKTVRTWNQALDELARIPAQALLVSGKASAATACDRAKRDELPYGTPAIYCDIPWLDEQASLPGVKYYLTKPVNRDKLLQVLADLGLDGGTVLIVDDDIDAQRLFRRMLLSSEPKWRVLKASNGEQGLKLCQDYVPDVVLLDLSMPIMDGYGLLREMSADPEIQHVPVVVVSAHNQSECALAGDALTLTRSGGLSIAQILASIEVFSAIAGPLRIPADPGRVTATPE